MSDFSIPGVSSKYGTQKIIDDLMKVERTKLTQMETVKKGFQDDKAIWQNMNRRMQTVRDSAKGLFGFNNPFGNKLGSSSDEKSLTAQATRAASNGEYQVKVLNNAGNDQFLSSSLPLDFQVPAGNYQFKVGEKEVSFSFKGGKLQSFVDAINLKNPALLKASVIKDTESSQIFQIEAVPVGEKNKLQFMGETKEAMTKLQVIGPPETFKKDLQGSPLSLSPGEKKTLAPEAAIKIPKGAILEMKVSVEKISPESLATPAKGFTYPEGGIVDFQDIRLQNSPMKGDLPTPDTPPAPQDLRDMKLATATGNGKVISLGELPESDKPVTFSFPIGESTDSFENLQLENKNTLRKVTISEARIIDPSHRGDYQPLHPLNQAKDAVLEFEGIKIVRDSNSISDVIPGVTLNLLAPSKDKVDVKIEPDRKTIKDGVITFMANYNHLLTDILVLTSYRAGDASGSQVLQEASYLTDEEKKAAEKNLGRFQGDISLNQVKSSLQKAMMNAYPTDDSEFKLLAQIGISTNVGGAGERVNASKLRGYLELDEQKFDAAVTKDIEGVKKLFGNAADGTLVVNSGAAFMVDEILKPYTQLGGFNASKMTSLDSQIKEKDKEMANYNDHLTRYQQDLRRKYGQMESAITSMQKNADQLNNLGR